MHQRFLKCRQDSKVTVIKGLRLARTSFFITVSWLYLRSLHSLSVLLRAGWEKEKKLTPFVVVQQINPVRLKAPQEIF